MNICKVLLTLVVSVGLFTSCVRKKEATVDSTPATPAVVNMPKKVVVSPQEKTMNLFAHLMEQADSVHREAWWVLTGERPPLLKSAFGKVQRAILSQQNAKLGNKSLFSCDRYEVKRDVMSQTGYPQKIEMYEKCSSKAPAKHMAFLNAQKEGEFEITFYPEGLQEVLGMSAAILNKAIVCRVRTNSSEQLLGLSCKDWAQEKNKTQMIRLDVYDYQKEGQDMIKLRGKIYENLTDIRKIEADVPMNGKITVTETELYAPTPSPTPKPSPMPSVTPRQSPVADGQQQPAEGQQKAATTPSGPVVVPMDQPTVLLPGGVIGGEGAPSSDAPAAESANPEATNHGWPTDENGNIIENPQPLEVEGEPAQPGQPQQPGQQQAPVQQEILHDQGAPSGR
jgi:hypothetical protein